MDHVIYLQSHDIESDDSLYPVRQVQLYPPVLSVQFCIHPPLSFRHSLISKIKLYDILMQNSKMKYFKILENTNLQLENL